MNFRRKLWWAQHKNGVYKYGTILSLVLIVTISIIYFTYSKFTSKNEMTAYETTVEPFIKNDYFIASYIDGEWSNEIPGKNDGYVVDKIVCDNGATGTWDNEEWGINIRNATKKIKCGVYFKPNVAKQIVELAASDTTNFALDDPDNNIRYFGSNPNNYVYFNCSDYSNQSDSTCEKWRIIGVFNNITKADGTKENLVKIIRMDSIGSFAWDYKEIGVGTSTSNRENKGSNDWSDSQLMMMLNPTDYLKSGYTIDNNIVKDSKGQAIYQNMGSYYNGTLGCRPVSITKDSSFSCTSKDFTSTGLKNDSTRNAIESVVWNLGGTKKTKTASEYYAAERGTTVYSGRTTTWTGKIGLMYPSDFAYATAGGGGSGPGKQSRSDCLASMLSTLSPMIATPCYGGDYLFKGKFYDDSDDSDDVEDGVVHIHIFPGFWTLTPYSSRDDGVYYIVSPSNLNASNYIHSNLVVRPTLYLKSNITIIDGAGSETNPYQLSVQ